jgi:hypothetical protein
MLERVPTLPRPAHRAFRKRSGAVDKFCGEPRSSASKATHQP